MLALAEHAGLAPEELTPPMLLTLLWMTEAYFSQVRAWGLGWTT